MHSLNVAVRSSHRRSGIPRRSFPHVPDVDHFALFCTSNSSSHTSNSSSHCSSWATVSQHSRESGSTSQKTTPFRKKRRPNSTKRIQKHHLMTTYQMKMKKHPKD